MFQEASRKKDRETERDKLNIHRKSSLQLDFKINPGKHWLVHKSNKLTLS